MKTLLAQYVPVDVVPQSVFKWGDIALYLLAIVATALAAVAIVRISVGIAKKIIGEYSGGGNSFDSGYYERKARRDGFDVFRDSSGRATGINTRKPKQW